MLPYLGLFGWPGGDDGSSDTLIDNLGQVIGNKGGGTTGVMDGVLG